MCSRLSVLAGTCNACHKRRFGAKFFRGQAMAKLTELEVNGKRYPVNYPPDTPLLYVLRDELGLTGSKYGCGGGQCGACTVLIGGAPRRACPGPASAAAGAPRVTIESRGKNGG